MDTATQHIVAAQLRNSQLYQRYADAAEDERTRAEWQQLANSAAHAAQVYAQHGPIYLLRLTEYRAGQLVNEEA